MRASGDLAIAVQTFRYRLRLPVLASDVYCMVQRLTVKEIEEIREDIKSYVDLDRATPTLIFSFGR